MTDRFFIDTNIWVYALSEQGDSREALARGFIESISDDAVPVVSYQVVNETIRVLKKLGKRESELRQIVEIMFDTCEVVGFTKDSALLASDLRENISISYWDSQIVASAILSGCDTVISEDMQGGVRIHDTLTIRNIFKP